MWEAVAAAIKEFGPRQVCWLCIALTGAGGWFFSTNYASAADVARSEAALAAMRAELAEIKGDAIAKRIYDYRVRHCDTPKELRQEKRWLLDQMRSDSDKYRKVTGDTFALPRCEDL